MNSIHLFILTALITILSVLFFSDITTDLANFQSKIRPDYQAYTKE